MQQSPLGDALHRFKRIKPDVWSYRDELDNLTRHLFRETDADEGSERVPIAGLTEDLVRDWLHGFTRAESRLRRRGATSVAVEAYLDEMVHERTEFEPFYLDELATEVELRKDLLDALATLPRNYTFALLLREGRGLSVGETARLMGTTPASVRSVLYRARQAIRVRRDI
jgi:DNA-directed RNA polymerase specialized sigma24 family protein